MNTPTTKGIDPTEPSSSGDTLDRLTFLIIACEERVIKARRDFHAAKEALRPIEQEFDASVREWTNLSTRITCWKDEMGAL